MSAIYLVLDRPWKPGHSPSPVKGPSDTLVPRPQVLSASQFGLAVVNPQVNRPGRFALENRGAPTGG